MVWLGIVLASINLMLRKCLPARTVISGLQLSARFVQLRCFWDSGGHHVQH
jgi:hypothetical protein